MPTPPNPHPAPHPATPLSPGQSLRIDAACVADHLAQFAPGSLILKNLPAGLTVLYLGPPESVPAPLREVTQTLTLPTSTILPPFANAHTHLDLTALGPRPHDPQDPAHGFATWLTMVREQRPTHDAAIRASVERGIALSLAGGVVAVGDIAGYPGRFSLEPYQALAATPMLGVSFLEFFAIGSTQQPRLEELQQALNEHADLFALTDPDRPRLGVQPHAPYSVSLHAYQELAKLVPPNVPRCTHLAETLAEREFIARATGPHRAFLESLGLWEDALLDSIGKGLTPVEHLAPVLESSPTPWLIAHANDCSPADIQTLARTGASVAYCPRAHNYFAHSETLAPHPWREMLDQGINLCLATDSIINLDTPNRITPLDDARLVYRQSLEASNPTDPSVLLRLITTNPAKALGLDPTGFTLAPGSRPLGVVEIEQATSLNDALLTNASPSLLP
ncbi:MAG: cytosine/adenosine deaminase-related metal-dependent hydrolase [Phycisphaerales bacterium]|jgi:cytosine/adenosine deaminase-related metal-dependent hydrolase